MATFSCGNCSHSRVVPDEFTGKQAKCPKCGQVSTVSGDPSTTGATGLETTIPPIRALGDSTARGGQPEFRDESSDSSPSDPSSRHAGSRFETRGLVLAAVIAALLATQVILSLRREVWEYKTVSVLADLPRNAIRQNEQALAFKVIPDLDPILREPGQEGWELVATIVEHETSHPNFGKEDYVTGLQPNIRPQRLLCIFKRSTWRFGDLWKGR